MFGRLTRPMRAKAGWFIALLYLLCMLAPGLALALGDAASCLMSEFPTTAATHVHDGAHQHGQRHQHDADIGAAHDHASHQHGGKDSSGPCCAMLCVPAIAADTPAVANPSPPVSRCVSANFQRLPGEAPPLLYRPPIA